MAKKHNQETGNNGEVVTTIGPDANGRYYYKAKTGNGYLNFKHPLTGAELEDYVEITKEEFDQLTYVAPHEPTAEELVAQEKARQIAQLKAELAATDYVVIKIAESDDADEIAALRAEYADVIAHRRQVRAQINELEGE